MLRINKHIKNILKEEIEKENPKIRLYTKVDSDIYSYDFENNEGFFGNRTDVVFENEVLDKNYKGITIIINK